MIADARRKSVRDRRIKLDANDVSKVQKFWKARQYKRMSKDTYGIIKVQTIPPQSRSSLTFQLTIHTDYIGPSSR